MLKLTVLKYFRFLSEGLNKDCSIEDADEILKELELETDFFNEPVMNFSQFKKFLSSKENQIVNPNHQVLYQVKILSF